MAVESLGEQPAGSPAAAPYAVGFEVADLPLVRRATAEWLARAGLQQDRASDFVLAVNEIATNAVRHGSPKASLQLHLDGSAVVAEIGDSGHWPPGPPPAGERGGMGLALARQVCDTVDIRTGGDGTTAILRMSLSGRQAGRRSPGQAFV